MDIYIIYATSSLLYLVFGAFYGQMGDSTPSAYYGIRTKLTLSNVEAWRFVHLKSSKPLIIIGVVNMIAGIILLVIQPTSLIAVLVELIIVASACCIIIKINNEAKSKFIAGGADCVSVGEKLYIGISLTYAFILLCFTAIMPILAELGPNPVFGFRSPRSMNSIESWRDTHEAMVLPLILLSVIFVILPILIAKTRFNAWTRVNIIVAFMLGSVFVFMLLSM